MVFPKSKTESDGFSMIQLLGGNAKGKGDENFALMLKQLGIDTEAAGSIKNGANFIDLSLLRAQQGTLELSAHEQKGVSTEAGKDLATLLESFNTEVVAIDDERTMLNPQLLQSNSDDTIKQMVAEAKTYLKMQIGDLAKRQGITVDMEALPKTLQSLSVIAEKIGIDVANMTLETLDKKIPNTTVSDKQLALLQPRQKGIESSTQALVRFKSDTKGDSSTKSMEATTPETGRKQESLQTLLHVRNTKEPTVHKTRNTVTTPMTTMTEVSTAPSTTKPLSTTAQQTLAPNMTAGVLDASQESIRPVERTATNSNTIDSDAALKLHTLIDEETPRKPKVDDVKQESKIASLVSPEGKSEGLELKVKEAKQMVSHVASSLKEAVENYKPPFTRLTMQLNPAKLGEVDVTMIQRGNNVHINISSNNNAIAVLAQHSVELKNQLANNGLGGATMQFNTGGGEQQRQSQHQHNMMEAYEKYAASEGEEQYETLASLELIIPRYV